MVTSYNYQSYITAVYCGFPGYLKNGEIVGKKYFFNDEIFYVCKKGFRINGIAKRRCQENGQWESGSATCEGIQKVK